MTDRSILALCYNGNKLGLAIYQELYNEIQVDSLSVNPEEIVQIVQTVKLQYDSNYLLIHPKIVSNPELHNAIISDNAKEIEFAVPKSSCWQSDYALDIILHKLVVKDMIQGLKAKSIEENFIKLNSRINLDDVPIRQALGALIYHIQTKVLTLDDGEVIVSTIKPMSLHTFLRIDDITLRSLQIFTDEKHPNILKTNQHNKEGFSLFSLLDRTNSLIGRRKLKEWMLKPLSDKSIIEYRLNMVDTMVNQDNKNFIREVSKLLHHVQDLPKILLRIKKVEASYKDWQKLLLTIEQGIQIIRLLLDFTRDNEKTIRDKENIASILSIENLQILERIHNLLSTSFDFYLSSEEDALCIRDDYDETLYDLRNIYSNLESYLNECGEKILDLNPTVNNLTVEYFPQTGYLVAINESETELINIRLDTPGENNFPDNTNVDNNNDYFVFIFKQGEIIYFKHRLIYELDENIGDIKSKINDRQKQLILEIEDQLLESETQLIELAQILALLDVFISFGSIASEMSFVKPIIHDESIIIIKNGRHPLQELTVESFISNDTYISKDKNVAIITGPNNSGKSVYLKQVGVLVYLAHIGSYLPCEKAIIGLTDSIMTRISSVETTVTPHSSFSIDLCQVSKMFNSATSQTLCLLDEFGKGTTPIDGVSLLAATVKKLIQMKVKTVCAIHFTEILHESIIEQSYMNQIIVFRMDVLTTTNCDNEEDEDDEELTPLYKLKLGKANSSEGIMCAKQAGLPTPIIERAKELKNQIENKQPIKANISITNSERGIYNQNNQELLRLFLNVANWNPENHSDIEESLRELKMKIMN